MWTLTLKPKYIRATESKAGVILQIREVPLGLDSKTPAKNLAKRLTRLTQHPITTAEIVKLFAEHTD